MARKRRPGRPIGSRDKIPRRTRGYKFGKPRRGFRQRKRDGRRAAALVPQQHDRPIANALNLMADLTEMVQREMVHNRGTMQALHESVKKLTDDAGSPTTQVLARRLLTLETTERITRGAHERINQLEEELRALRRDLGEIITEQHNLRNVAEVRTLAEDHHGHE